MDVDEITIADNTYPFLLGVGAVRKFARETGRDNVGLTEIDEVLQQINIGDELDTLLWCAMKCGASYKEEELDLTREQLTQMIDDHPHVLDTAMDKILGQQPPQDMGNPTKAGKETSSG